MKLEQQVTSLELSKKLKELGVKQDSLFYWVDKFPLVTIEPIIVDVKKFDNYYEGKTEDFARALKNNIYSAFTVAELGNLMPKEIEDTNSEGLKRLFFFDTWKCNSGFLWRCAYSYYENMNRANTRIEYLKGVDGDIGAETEADCRAKMLIWLVENGYLQLESEGQDE